MKSNWNYPTTVWTGENRINDIYEACSFAKITNPLFVTDKNLISLPMTIKLIEKLRKNFKELNIFSKFSGNPIGENITDGVETYNKAKSDGVIAFGGGSALTNKNGEYKFFTIIPGAYPWKNHNNAWRPKHIHFSLISANFFSRLNTQMYFPDDVLLSQDPIFNSVKEKFRNKLIANFNNKENNVTGFITYKFNIVMP